AGLPGSWVRLTRLQDGWRGLIYDGHELYVVAPAAAVESELDVAVPGATRNSTLVFRAADTDSATGDCKVVAPQGSAGAAVRTRSQPDYKTVFAELQSFAPQITAALPTLELDLALVGDTQFAAQFASPSGEMLARLNNVDGIFSGQVGVKIVSGYSKVLTNNAGMTSTVPETLLDQFDSYRRATPEAASRGLAHLMTGRDLDGSTIGIAYMSTLCAPQFAVSLSQTYLDTFNSSLVAAHEIGHNFGAPHDGVSGACASTPQSYLMAPAIIGTSQFSACSLSQMSPVVASATCLRVIQAADVTLEFPATSIAAYSGQDTHVLVSVVSRGTAAAQSVALTLYPDFAFSLVGGTFTGGACTLQAGNLSCNLGTLAAGTQRQVDVVLRGSRPATTTLRATVSATDDIDSSNNSSQTTLVLTAAADGALSSTNPSYFGDAGQAIAFPVTLGNSGPQALANAGIVLVAPTGFSVVAAGTGATCSTTGDVTTCTFGTIEAGGQRTVNYGVVSATPQQAHFDVRVTASNDGQPANDSLALYVTAEPPVELFLTTYPGTYAIPLGGDVTQQFDVFSGGSQAANDATFTVTSGPEADVVGVTATDATCARDDSQPRTWRCAFAAPIEGDGGMRSVAVQLRGVAVGLTHIDAMAAAPQNQHLPGTVRDPSAITVNFEVRQQVDMRMDPRPPTTAYDHRSFTVLFSVTSLGASPAPNARFEVTLPADLRITATQAGAGPCMVTAGTVTCDLGTVPSTVNIGIAITVTSDVTGHWTLSPHVTADGDAVPGNDSGAQEVVVSSNVDLQVLPLATGVTLAARTTLDYTVSLRAGTADVPGAGIMLLFDDIVQPVDVRTSQGTCDAAAQSFTCSLGTLAANSTASIVVTVRGIRDGSGAVVVNASATGEVDTSNNRGTGLLTVRTPGDVRIIASNAAVSATTGTAFNLPLITVRAVNA
ncbi:MAG TPA: M12 family metallo-peptidase, partial [Steroidobacteraceae bacterium]